MGIVTSAGEPKISREQNYLAENPTRKKKMILLVAILAFGGLAIDAETTPDYGEDYWGGTVSNLPRLRDVDAWKKKKKGKGNGKGKGKGKGSIVMICCTQGTRQQLSGQNGE